jgi:hypothetical protein
LLVNARKSPGPVESIVCVAPMLPSCSTRVSSMLPPVGRNEKSDDQTLPPIAVIGASSSVVETQIWSSTRSVETKPGPL